MPKSIDLTGTTINNWYLKEKLPSGYYKSICLLCNNEYKVSGYKIKNNKSKCCANCSNKLRGESTRNKLENSQINNWYVKRYIGNSKYECICKCGNVRTLATYDLTHNTRKYCDECANKHKSLSMREDLDNKIFGNLKVIEYLGNQYYKCECSCKNIHIASAYCLKHQISTSCKECSDKNRSKKYRESILYKYGDISSTRINNPRELWKINLLNNKDDLINYINSIANSLGRLPTSIELANKLDISVHILLTYTRQYLIELYTGEISNGEFQIRDIFSNNQCKYNDRTKIKPQELDIYIPDKKLAIEFNGNYWHSSIFKSPTYHQDKTLACVKNNIRLVHIFEYEWNNKDKRLKLENLLSRLAGNHNTKTLYARNTDIRLVNKDDTKEFLNKYHLQGYTTSSINIGMYYNNEIIGLMTFGKPRFNNNYEYEIIRLVYKDTVNVVGGTQKLFKYFIKNYNPTSIITYADISKFTGNIYTQLGFKVHSITKPNYNWVNTSTNEVLPRYKTTKAELVKRNLGSVDETEDEIMYNLGYYKVYDCGNLKLTWSNT